MSSENSKLQTNIKIIQPVDQTVAGRGLGDVIEAVTKKFGIKPCEGCKKRKDYLNKYVRWSR